MIQLILCNNNDPDWEEPAVCTQSPWRNAARNLIPASASGARTLWTLCAVLIARLTSTTATCIRQLASECADGIVSIFNRLPV